jgi:hypothetical protein
VDVDRYRCGFKADYFVSVRQPRTRLQVHAVANDHDPVQREARFGAVPSDELIDGVFIDAARGWRAEAVEHGQFAMIQIRQPKHPATVIRLDFLFTHSDGLPCRSIGTTADRLGDASLGSRGLGDFERYGLFSPAVLYPHCGSNE